MGPGLVAAGAADGLAWRRDRRAAERWAGRWADRQFRGSFDRPPRVGHLSTDQLRGEDELARRAEVARDRRMNVAAVQSAHPPGRTCWRGLPGVRRRVTGRGGVTEAARAAMAGVGRKESGPAGALTTGSVLMEVESGAACAGGGVSGKPGRRRSGRRSVDLGPIGGWIGAPRPSMGGRSGIARGLSSTRNLL